ncbi:MAG: radical SAM protein [Petrotogaceae bacterium]|nr:radical SAM protein [Petrotogaceae bacterium]
MRAVIIDGYVDEPAVLGVPPYISPYIRYSAGALIYRSIETDYITIDEIRKNDFFSSFDSYDYIIIIAGTTVPGHYFMATPISLYEIKKIFDYNSRPLKVLGGPIARGYTLKGGSSALLLKDYLKESVDFVIPGDIEKFLFKYPVSDDYNLEERSDYELTDMLSTLGAQIVTKHHMFPNVMLEIDVSRGCDRKDGFCSFCTEPLTHGAYRERKVSSVISEIKTLNSLGVRNFRFGRSANFLAYGSAVNKNLPNPALFEELYSEISGLSDVLHTDNANADFIAKYEKECRKIIGTIAKYNTSGDILSFGVETFDPEVSQKNRLYNSNDSILKAVQIVNEEGGWRDSDMIPKILPGINILYGLLGETKDTYEKNIEYLKMIYDKKFMLRRINVRQVMVFPGTFLYDNREKVSFDKKSFVRFKEFMTEYDSLMLQRVFPIGTVIRNILPQENRGEISFGRQIGTYPILCGTYSDVKMDVFFDGKVVDYGSRSVTVIDNSKRMKDLSVRELSSIKGIGRKTAEAVFLSQDSSVDKMILERKQKEILQSVFKG